MKRELGLSLKKVYKDQKESAEKDTEQCAPGRAHNKWGCEGMPWAEPQPLTMASAQEGQPLIAGIWAFTSRDLQKPFFYSLFPLTAVLCTGEGSTVTPIHGRLVKLEYLILHRCFRHFFHIVCYINQLSTRAILTLAASAIDPDTAERSVRTVWKCKCSEILKRPRSLSPEV